MQKYILLSLLILAPFAVADDTDKLSDAIEKQDIEKVKKFLKRIGEFEPVVKKNLLEDAQDMVDFARGNVSLLRSKWDLAKFIVGSSSAVTGAVWAGICGYISYEIFNENPNRTLIRDRNGNLVWRSSPNTTGAQMALGATVISSVVAVVGGYYAVKGYYCDTAFGKVTHARNIANLIKKAPAKGEDQLVVAVPADIEKEDVQ